MERREVHNNIINYNKRMRSTHYRRSDVLRAKQTTQRVSVNVGGGRGDRCRVHD